MTWQENRRRRIDASINLETTMALTPDALDQMTSADILVRMFWLSAELGIVARSGPFTSIQTIRDIKRLNDMLTKLSDAYDAKLLQEAQYDYT